MTGACGHGAGAWLLRARAGRGCWDSPAGIAAWGCGAQGCYQQSGMTDNAVAAGPAREPGSGGDLIGALRAGSSAGTRWALSVCKGLAGEARNEVQEDSAVSALLHFAATLQEHLWADCENPRACKTSRFRRSLTWWLAAGAPWGNTAAHLIPHSSNPSCSSHLRAALAR